MVQSKQLAMHIKQKYKIPLMKAKMIAIETGTFEKADEYLANTKEGWCWAILDYRDSDELKELRKSYKGK